MKPGGEGKRKWTEPSVMKFADASGDNNNKGHEGTHCGESVVRYGAPCGIRDGQECRLREGQACEPNRLGASCSAREGTPCIDRLGTPCDNGPDRLGQDCKNTNS